MLAANPDCVVLAEYLPRLEYSGKSGLDVLQQYADEGFSISTIQTAIVPLPSTGFAAAYKNIGSSVHGSCHDLILRRTLNPPT